MATGRGSEEVYRDICIEKPGRALVVVDERRVDRVQLNSYWHINGAAEVRQENSTLVIRISGRDFIRSYPEILHLLNSIYHIAL